MRVFPVALALVASLAIACGDDPVRPPGTVRVLLTTTGADADVTYEIRTAGRAITVPSTSATIEVPGIPRGEHQIVLGDVAANCTVADGGTRSITVASNTSTDVQFNVSCVSTSAAIGATVLATGANIDPSYTVQVGTATAQTVAAGATRYFTGLAAGTFNVTLGGLASNCTVAPPNPRQLTVVIGTAVRDTARTTFNVTCTAPPPTDDALAVGIAPRATYAAADGGSHPRLADPVAVRARRGEPVGSDGTNPF